MEISRTYFCKLKKFHDSHNVMGQFTFRVNDEGEREALPVVQVTCGSLSMATTREMIQAYVAQDNTLGANLGVLARLQVLLQPRGAQDEPVQENLIDSPMMEYSIYLRGEGDKWRWFWWLSALGLALTIGILIYGSTFEINPMPYNRTYYFYSFSLVTGQPDFYSLGSVGFGNGDTLELQFEMDAYPAYILGIVYIGLIAAAWYPLLMHDYELYRQGFGARYVDRFDPEDLDIMYRHFCQYHGYTHHIKVTCEKRIYEKLRTEFAMWQVTDPGSGTIQRGVINHPWTQHLDTNVREQLAWLIVQEAQIDRFSRVRMFGKVNGRDDRVTWHF